MSRSKRYTAELVVHKPRHCAISFMIAMITLWLGAQRSLAEVKLTNTLFSDHMVLQSGTPVPVWGEAAPGEKVTVSLGDQTSSTTADQAGHWQVKLGPLKADTIPEKSTGTGRDLIIAGKNTITLRDVLVGEVWLGSGQSNMVLAVKGSANSDKEIADADRPMIRLFHVTSQPADEPMSTVRSQWIVCSPKSVQNFSAAAYFFGRDLQGELHVPVGLIQSAVGGTPIETWMRREAPMTQPSASGLPATPSTERQPPGAEPATQPGNGAVTTQRSKTYYNSMIAPLAPYGMRGILWYQGESNAGLAAPAI